MIDRTPFLAAVNAHLFDGSATPSQVAGINDILDEADLRKLSDPRDPCYVLATTYWETDKAMQPVREAYYMGEPTAENYRKTLRYYPFYGRGPSQMTWQANYAAMTAHLGKRFNVDLVKNPDDALRLDVSMAVLFEGMIFGMFTGVSLSTYFNATTDNPIDARRIINGTDHEADIASIYHGFLSAAQGIPYYRLLAVGCAPGGDVKLVQSALQAFGFYSNMIVDGVYGAGTRLAVMGFQLSKELDADGAVGPDTRAALGLT